MITIIETLDYGQSLLSDGSILKADGTIISKEKYEQQQQFKQRNKLDWTEIDVNDFVDSLQKAIFSTKTYEINDNQQGMSITKQGFVFIDEEGNPAYLRAQEFSGSEKYEIAQVSYSQLIYNVNKNSSDTAFEAMSDILQNLFGVEEQVGSIFSPDNDTSYLIKKFVKDNHVWSMVFKNNKLSNIKQGEKLHSEAEAKPKTSKLSDALNNAKFTNMY